MLTPSHWLIGAVVARVRSRRGTDVDATADATTRRSWLWGAVAPDLPLYALSIGSAVYFPLARGWTFGRTFQHIYGDLFFTHPVWIAANNVLHSPVSLALVTAATWRRRSTPLRAFLLGAALHTAVDIPVHHDDGPVLMWPFEWSTRFHSPVSYWDPAHHGRAFSVFEYALIAAMAAYLWRTRTPEGATATRS